MTGISASKQMTITPWPSRLLTVPRKTRRWRVSTPLMTDARQELRARCGAAAHAKHSALQRAHRMVGLDWIEREDIAGPVTRRVGSRTQLQPSVSRAPRRVAQSAPGGGRVRSRAADARGDASSVIPFAGAATLL